MPSERGFTLIELLVVLTIIGITLSVALLAFGDFGADRRIHIAATHFSNQLELLSEQAILESTTFGIEFTPHGYRILKFTPPQTWTRLSSNTVLRDHAFPEQTSIHFQSNRPEQTPAIILYPTGEMTPFTLTFGRHILQGYANGTRTLQRQTGP